MITLKTIRYAYLSFALLLICALLPGCGSSPTPGSIRITADNTAVTAGASTQLHAADTSSLHLTTDATTTATWSSSNSSVATVGATGMLTGISAGTAVITAVLGQDAGSFSISIGAPLVTSLSLTPPNPSVYTRSTMQFKAIAAYANNSTGDASTSVQWAATPSSVATISSSGLLTAVAPGSFIVTAATTTQSTFVTGTVTNAPIASIAVTSSGGAIAGGTTRQFTATATYADQTTADITNSVTWTSSNSNLLPINASGLASAQSGTVNGSVTITAQSGTTAASATVQVNASAYVTSLTVKPTSSSIAEGSAEVHTALATYSDGSQADVTSSVTWSVVPFTSLDSIQSGGVKPHTRAIHAQADNNDPPVVTVTQTGMDTAVTPGTTTVEASMGDVQSQSVVIVTPATIQSLEIRATRALFPVGSVQPVKLIGKFSDGSSQDLSLTANWQTSDPTIATIDGTGQATGIKAGNIQFTASFGGMTTSTIGFQVLPSNLVSTTVDTDYSVLALGPTEQFRLIGTYSDGTTHDLTSIASWKSSNPKVFPIDAETGIGYGLSAGAAQISGIVDGRTAILNVAAVDTKLLSIEIFPQVESLAHGTTRKFLAVGYFDLGTTADITGAVTWRSNDPAILTIDAAGRAKSGANGTTQLTASLLGVTATSSNLTVTSAQLSRLNIQTASTQIAALTGQQYNVTGIFDDGSFQDLTADVIWNTSDNTIASIDADGFGIGMKPGRVQVTASFAGKTTSLPLTVTNATITSVEVSPGNSEIPIGVVRQFSLTGNFSDGTRQDLTQDAIWSAPESGIAGVAFKGQAVGISPGLGTIAAQRGYFNASTPVTVTNATLNSMTLTPTSAAIRKGATQFFTTSGVFSDGFTLDLGLDATLHSSVPSVAGIFTYDLVAGVSVGSAQISATYRDQTASTTSFRVLTDVLTGISINPPNPSLAAGNTQQFTATGTYADGTTGDVSGLAVWTSSNPALLNVDENGLATAYDTPNNVSVTVTAQSGGATASFTVKVLPAGSVVPTLTTVAITPNTASFAAGTTKQFSLIGTYSDGSTADLSANATWTSSSPSVATISSTGLATGVGTGSVQFSSAYAGQTASTGSVQVTPATPPGQPVLVSVSLSPNTASFAAGTTKQFSLIGAYSDGTTQNLSASATWTTSNSAVATISSTGLATGVAAGSVRFAASYSGMSATTGPVQITPATPPGPPTLTSIIVNPTSSHAAAGTTVQLTATGSYSDGSTQDLSGSVTWSSSDNTLATVGATGLVTAVSPGLASVQATLGSLSNTAVVRVSAATLVSVAISPSGASFAAGATQQFTLTGTFSDGSTQDLSSSATWSSSAPSVASISATGLATGVSVGSVQFTSTYGSQTATTTTVQVTPATLVSIAVTPANPSFAEGTTVQFTVTGTYSDGTTRDLTGSSTYTSSNPSVVSISSSGLATGLGAGTVTITSASGGQTASTQSVTVNPVTLVSIAINPNTPSFASGTTQRFTATGTFSDGSTQDLSSQVTWTSSNPAVLTIDATGLASSLSTGSVVVSAALNGVAASTGNVTVTPATLVNLTISPTSAQIAKGTTRQFTATGHYTDGTTQNLSSNVAWISSDGAVVAIDANGLATGSGVGSAQLTATFQGQSVSTSAFQVTPATLVSIAFNPSHPSVAAGTSTSVAVIGTFSDGTTQDLSSAAAYTSSNPSAVTIDTPGILTGVAPGAATITVTVDGMTATFDATTTNARLATIAITPAVPPSFAKGTTEQFTATGTYTDGSTQDLTTSVTWTSSDPTVFTVDNHGLATGTGVGSATLTAAYMGTIAATPAIQVTPAVVASVTISPTNPTVMTTSTQQFTATANYTDGTTVDVTIASAWSSSNTLTASIGANTGLATGIVPGSVTIQVVSGSFTASTTLTVTLTPPAAATLQSITVTPASASIVSGATQQYTATGNYSDGSTQNLTTQVAWSSSSTQVATINSTGLAAAVAAGVTTIQAQLNATNGTTSLTVTNPAPPSATLTSIAVTPSSASITNGATQQFTATGTYSDGSSQNLTTQAAWSSSNTSVATINSTGLATAVSAGTTTIQAQLNGTSGAATLTVPAAQPVPTLTSIAVTPSSPSITNGSTQQFTATGTYSDGSTQNLTTQVAWSSSNTSAATINSTGLATAASAGSATIRAQLNGTSGTATLTVTTAQPAPTLTSITVTPANPSIAKGSTQQFTATGTYSDGSTQNLTTQVTWQSLLTTVATIDSNGLLTAQLPGATQIEASFQGQNATTNVTVTAAALVSIAVTPATATIANGTTQQYQAVGAYTDGSTQNLTATVTWSSSNASIASINVLGLATAASVGQTTISAQSGAITGAATLNVTSATVSSVQLTPALATLPAGAFQQLMAAATFTDGTSQDVTSAAVYSSSNPGTATVDATGKVHAIATGAATIAATLGSSSANSIITVTPASITSITITPASPSLAAGTTQQFTATASFSDGSTQDITNSAVWASSNSAVATILPTGYLAAVQTGNTSVTATSGNVSGSTTVTVTAATISAITVTPAVVTLAVGQTQPFAATATMTDGTQQTVTASVHWSVSDGSKGTISNSTGSNGLLTTTASGVITVTASSGAIVSTPAVVTITTAALNSITVTPNPASLQVGATQLLTVTGHYSDGSTASLNSSSIFVSANPTVALADTTGLIHAVTTGSTSITVTIAGSTATATVPVTVTSATLNSIAIAPSAPNLALGTQTQLTATGTYSDGSTASLTTQVQWTSATPTVATVSTTGLLSSVATGTSTVTATLNAISQHVTATVTSATLQSIAVQAAQTTFAKGQTLQLTAIGTYSDGSTQDLTSSVTWSSLNPSVGIVSSTGLATGVAPGSFTAQATRNGVTGSLALTVTSAVLQSIAVTPANSILINVLGASKQFTAIGTYSDGTTQSLTNSVHWGTTGVVVGSISQSGVFSPLGVGLGTVTATLGTVTGQTNITIVSAGI